MFDGGLKPERLRSMMNELHSKECARLALSHESKEEVLMPTSWMTRKKTSYSHHFTTMHSAIPLFLVHHSLVACVAIA